MNRILAPSWAIVFLCIASAAAVAQDALPYKEGPVVMVTSVRTQPGKFNDYFRYLAGPYSQMMNQAKQQGLLSSFAFYGTVPKSPDEPDLYIVETYPNMAVFDTMTEKMAAISGKVFGSLKQSDAADANREEIRKILGTEMIRELVPVKTSATD
jgi:hypothetical protein